jgi:SAM-dependent methyltransferase
VLDVGFARGLLLIGAARRSTTGNAIGLDRWLAGDLTGNRPEAVIDNARIEGVLNRIEVKQGDVRQLPISDDSFDVVVSNYLLHELKPTTLATLKLVRHVAAHLPARRIRAPKDHFQKRANFTAAGPRVPRCIHAPSRRCGCCRPATCP